MDRIRSVLPRADRWAARNFSLPGRGFIPHRDPRTRQSPKGLETQRDEHAGRGHIPLTAGYCQRAGAGEEAFRFRIHMGGLYAGPQAPLGLLCPADPVRRRSGGANGSQTGPHNDDTRNQGFLA